MAALLAATAAAALLAATQGRSDEAGAAGGRPEDPPTAPAAASASPTADGGSTAGPVSPRRLRIPTIGIDTSLETLRVSAADRLRPPRDPDRAGWFPASAVPGELGAAVVAGHRDSRVGKAVFWRLTELRTGDRLSVTLSDGRVVPFEVVDVRRVARRAFPTAAVYGPTPDRTLRLITCGGLYDHVHGRYVDNVLVLALAV